MAHSAPPTAAPRPAHPQDEFLVAYVTRGLNREEEQAVETHVQACDSCIEMLAVIQHRLAREAELAVAVPGAVRRRVTSVLPAPRSFSDLIGWVADLLPLQAMIPVAVAAGVMLTVGVQTWLHHATPGQLTRGVPWQQSLRVTAPEAVVRTQPSGHGEVVATLNRGTVVQVSAEERDWYRISVRDGPEGWVERDAFK